jgi:HAD superfamily hydrolase (TIGR01509 family)
MIRALVFDFDGLILDTETPLIDAWAAVYDRAGVPYDRATALGLVGHIDLDFDPWAGFGPGADRAALDRLHHDLSQEWVGRQPVLPGVADYLAGARRRGLVLAVASNSSHRHVDGHLHRLGLAPCFDLVRCREDVPAGKPAPDLYLSVIRHFAIEPAHAIAFEDSPPGVIAARRAGLRCVAVPNPSTRHHDFSHADLRLESLAGCALPELLDRFAGGAGQSHAG